MYRRFLSVGEKFNDTDAKKAIIHQAIQGLEWFHLPLTEKLPFMQGEGIKAMIQQMGKKVDKIAHGVIGNGLGLLAMRNNYSDGEVRRATLYAIDLGDQLVPVAVDEENETDLITHS